MKTFAANFGRALVLAAALAAAGCNAGNAASNNTSDPLAYRPAPSVEQLPPPAAPTPDFAPSPNLADVIKLVRAGVGENLTRRFIQNTVGTFGLGAKEIVYLNDLGASESIINAMLDHDRALAAAAPVPPAAVPAAVPTVVQQPAPPVVVVEQPAPVTVNYFYDTLAPYGSWVELDGYGRCWQPSVIAFQPGWRPYCDRGRWVSSDCGWYWSSEYSWGGVVFHYGRWFQHPRLGWCWSPDTVWSPAWVSWRHSEDFCGWSPLPPAAVYRPGVGFFYHDRAVGVEFDFDLHPECYTFVPRRNFTDEHPWQHAIARPQAAQIFRQTAVINNYSSVNNRPFNHGFTPGNEHAASARNFSTPQRPVAPAPITVASITPAFPIARPAPVQTVRPPALPLQQWPLPTQTSQPPIQPERRNSWPDARDAAAHRVQPVIAPPQPQPVQPVPAAPRPLPVASPQPVVAPAPVVIAPPKMNFPPRDFAAEHRGHDRNQFAGENVRVQQILAPRPAPVVETPHNIVPVAAAPTPVVAAPVRETRPPVQAFRGGEMEHHGQREFFTGVRTNR